MTSNIVTKLGRIISVKQGFGGRYESEFGLFIVMGALKHNGQEDSEWAIETFRGVSRVIPLSDSVAKSVEYLAWVISLLEKSNKTEVLSLVGVPVLCQFQNEQLIQWEIWENTV